MKPTRFLNLVLTALAAAAVTATAQNGSGLLLPFPKEASGTSPATADAVPERLTAPPAPRGDDDTRRATELAETFIRRQQMEISNSVPRRNTGGETRIPVRKAPDAIRPGTAIAAASRTGLPMLEFDPVTTGGGPSTDLLPLPGDESHGAPIESVLPDAAMIPGAGDVPPDITPSAALEDTVPESDVPRSELAPAPAYGEIETQERRGPVFRVDGAEAFTVARARGFRFTPAGGIGTRDGNHTAASQFPNLLTSEVHGTRMSQLRPPATWSVQETSNTFFMFCDANYNAVRLNPGWRIRGIRLEGPNWRWVACPRSGAGTASFSVRLHSFRDQENATSVKLSGLTLEGPPGATDWKEAFPWLNGRGPKPGETIPGKPAAGESPPEALANSGAAPRKSGPR